MVFQNYRGFLCHGPPSRGRSSPMTGRIDVDKGVIETQYDEELNTYQDNPSEG